jgi:YhcH/YjgK/YiaL family protein
MIFDQLSNLEKYSCIPNHALILDFFKNNDPLELNPGEIELQGKELFVKVLHYMPQAAEKNKFETHQMYADVQVILRGCETMQIVSPQQLTPLTEYDPKTDFQFFSAGKDITPILVQENEFVYFPPGQPHKPGCFYRSLKEPIVKLVFKTRDPAFANVA